MAAPTSYTESALVDFMLAELGKGVILETGLDTDDDPLVQGVYAVQRLLGLADIADATDMALVEAAARWKAWRAAFAAVSAESDLKAGSAQLWDSQISDKIKENLALAEADYYAALATSRASIGSSSFVAFATLKGCRGR